MIATSVGRGDVGPFRHDGTNVRRTAEALVAIGDGADAEHAHGRCSPWVEGDLRNDVGGHTRRCTIIIVTAVVIVIAAQAGARAAMREPVVGSRMAARGLIARHAFADY